MRSIFHHLFEGKSGVNAIDCGLIASLMAVVIISFVIT